MATGNPITLCTLVLVAAGCGGSLYQLKRVASKENNCPVSQIESLYCKNREAMLNVCGTRRLYNYQALHATGILFPPRSWQEIDIGANLFQETWFDLRRLHDAWGTSANNIWMVGTEGAVFHFDGQRWSAMACDANPSHHFGVWGADANAVWIVGTDGKVLRWDGQVWTGEQLPTSQTLFGVHGTSRTDLWLVGQKGLIVHGDGTTWTKVASGVTKDLYRVWAIRRDLAWAVGDGGMLLRWDGRRWTARTLGTRAPLVTIWASGMNDVWAGALTGQVYRWDGRRWSPVRIHSDADMRRYTCLDRILGFGPNDVWAMGCQVHHYDGRSWQRRDWDPAQQRVIAGGGAASWGSSSRDLYGVAGWGATDSRTHSVHVIHGTYYHWDDRRWTERRWPMWPCNQPRGRAKSGLHLRPRGVGY